MKRGAIIGATGGLIAGVSLGALALAAPGWASLNGVHGAQLSAPVVAQQAAPVAAQQGRWGVVPNLSDLVQQVSPSVVQIQVRSPNSTRLMSGPGREGNPFEGTPFEDFFQRNFPGGQAQPGQEMPDRRGAGSGFLIQGGYIVTNNHVVDDASRMTVVFDDGREMTATLVGTDPKTDLAVIKVDGGNLPPALAWGDSTRARPGDNVFAIGSPFGLGNTVTAGIVSARGRSLGQSYDDYIQVDAPINQGNSGGPLFDASGRVIGVNSAIYSPTGGNVGIGFSIPADLAQNIVQQIIQNGSVERGWLGVGIQEVTPEIAAGLNLPSAKGALVNLVNENSPAARAGVKERDLIVAYGDREIRDLTDLTRAVADTKAGTTKDLKIIRDGRQQTLKVRIDKLAAEAGEPTRLAGASPSSAGALSMSELGLGLASNGDGLVVANVKVNSAAFDAGLRQGDKVISINQVDVKTPDAAKKAVDEAKKQKRSAVLMQVERDGQRRFVGVPFSEG
ncbi:MAG TPA: Do family serine endopeptidase [Hyphomonadaceae bacterium]|jgi:serine protease Do